MNFSAYYRDGASRSEIEVFVSRKGNYTGFHQDFQENFIIQLKGRKIWYVLKSENQDPLRGFTPHYEKTGNLESQLKLIYQKGHLKYNK